MRWSLYVCVLHLFTPYLPNPPFSGSINRLGCRHRVHVTTTICLLTEKGNLWCWVPTTTRFGLTQHCSKAISNIKLTSPPLGNWLNRLDLHQVRQSLYVYVLHSFMAYLPSYLPTLLRQCEAMNITHTCQCHHNNLCVDQQQHTPPMIRRDNLGTFVILFVYTLLIKFTNPPTHLTEIISDTNWLYCPIPYKVRWCLHVCILHMFTLYLPNLPFPWLDQHTLLWQPFCITTTICLWVEKCNLCRWVPINNLFWANKDTVQKQSITLICLLSLPSRDCLDCPVPYHVRQPPYCSQLTYHIIYLPSSDNVVQ